MTTNTSTLAISARAVRKSFGDHVALDGVDLTVTKGTIFALLGPNGAGKTTVVNILSTLLKPDAGTATVNGFDVATQPATCGSPSASPGSSRPWTRSSPGART